MTGNELVARALRLIGKLSEGETPTAEAAQDARSYANDLLDQWKADGRMVYAETPSTQNLSANTGSYTFGTGGTWNRERPVEILRAVVIPDSTATNPIEIPMEVATDQRWASIRVKSTTSSFPYILHYDRRMVSGLATAYVYPVPTNSNAQVKMWLRDLISTFADLTTDYTYPPGYALALRVCLARLMAPEYGVPVPPGLDARCEDALEVITAVNRADEQLVVDRALRRGGGYNILTDEGR